MHLKYFYSTLAGILLVFSVGFFLHASPSAEAISTSQDFACEESLCAKASARILSVDSERSAVLNPLLSGLLGTEAELSVEQWDSLAKAHVDAYPFIELLKLRLNAVSVEEVLGADLRVADLYSVTAELLRNNGQVVDADALDALSAELLAVGSVQLGDFLDFGTGHGALLASRLNALELVLASAQAANHRHFLESQTAVSIDPALSGQSDALAELSLRVQVLEPPVLTCSKQGSEFFSAAMRLEWDAGFALGALTSKLPSIAGVSGVDIALNTLPIYVDVGRVHGAITLVDAISQRAEVDATPGIADVYIGEMNEGTFFKRDHKIKPESELSFRSIGTVTIDDITLALHARGVARGESPSKETLVFHGPYPETQTVETHPDFIVRLTDDVLANLELRFSSQFSAALVDLGPLPTIGLLDDLNLPLLKDLLTLADPASLEALILDETRSLLRSEVISLLAEATNPLLESTGARLGEAIVSVQGFQRSCRTRTGLADVDQDGIADAIDGTGDQDSDGIQNLHDRDSDNDGIPDTIEGPVDSDGDGVRDFLDLDSDNDGVLDITEVGLPDVDRNGMVDEFSDINRNGQSDNREKRDYELSLHADDDGRMNHVDIDADDDGITDTVEATPSGSIKELFGSDTNQNGIDDAFDPHAGFPSLIPIDTDLDGVYDMHDLDTDNDGFVDLIEGHDADLNGIADRGPIGMDQNANGLDDAFDPAQGGVASPVQDADNDGEPDWRDNGAECTVSCESVKLGLYIINPDGTERHMDTAWTRVETLNDTTIRVGFEDKGADFDHNDVVLDIERPSCTEFLIHSFPLEARWHHQIRAKVFTGEREFDDILLWEDSHQSPNEAKRLDIASSLLACNIAAKEECRLRTPIERDLQVGSTGDDVKALQEFLSCKGFFPDSVQTTTYYGSITREAVISLQRDASLPPAGIVGSQTRAHLETYSR